MYISKLYPVSKHDSTLFKENLAEMMSRFSEMSVCIPKDCVTNLDPGFDSVANKKACKEHGLTPNIKINPRNSGKKATAPNPAIYSERYVNERAFAWEDTYRRLVTRYEVYARNHLALTQMAAALTLLRLIT